MHVLAGASFRYSLVYLSVTRGAAGRALLPPPPDATATGGGQRPSAAASRRRRLPAARRQTKRTRMGGLQAVQQDEGCDVGEGAGGLAGDQPEDVKGEGERVRMFFVEKRACDVAAATALAAAGGQPAAVGSVGAMDSPVAPAFGDSRDAEFVASARCVRRPDGEGRGARRARRAAGSGELRRAGGAKSPPAARLPCHVSVLRPPAPTAPRRWQPLPSAAECALLPPAPIVTATGGGQQPPASAVRRRQKRGTERPARPHDKWTAVVSCRMHPPRHEDIMSSPCDAVVRRLRRRYCSTYPRPAPEKTNRIGAVGATFPT